jgi:hypothetical protein
MLKGMKTDLTWDNSAKLYSRLYTEARQSRDIVDAKTA